MWARANNLQLNRGKTKEIIFVDMRRKRSVFEPPVLPGITRVTSLTVLGVTLKSASDHVRHVISKSAQTLYALRVLRAKGMPDEALQVVFRSVIVCKLLFMRHVRGAVLSHTRAFFKQNLSLRKQAPKARGSRHRRCQGGVWRGGIPLPSRLGGLGERRKLPQRGPGRSPGRKRICGIL